MRLSKIELILGDSPTAIEPPTNVLGPEPPHRWRYYFQKADLARKLGDWEQISALADITFALEDRPNDASERLPFIEGYAHVGRWEDAASLSLEIVEEQQPMWATVCRTWARLEDSAPDGGGRQEASERIYESIPCDELRAEG